MTHVVIDGIEVAAQQAEDAEPDCRMFFQRAQEIVALDEGDLTSGLSDRGAVVEPPIDHTAQTEDLTRLSHAQRLRLPISGREEKIHGP